MSAPSIGQLVVDAAAFAERPGIDVHDAGDAVGSGVGDAVRDGAAARVADEHDVAVEGVDDGRHRVDVGAQADARSVGVDRLETGKRERVHAVTGLFEERRDPLP